MKFLVGAPEVDLAPARSRSQLAFFAWATLVARSVITMATAFVTTPYLLRFLGAERLGAFRASQQWTNYLTFLYVGLAPTLAVLLLRPASRGDLAGMVGVLKSGMRITMRQIDCALGAMGRPCLVDHRSFKLRRGVV